MGKQRDATNEVSYVNTELQPIPAETVQPNDVVDNSGEYAPLNYFLYSVILIHSVKESVILLIRFGC